MYHINNILDYNALIINIILKLKIHQNLYEDALQEGYLALLLSAQKWNRSTKFTTYAYRNIYWRLIDFKKNNKKICYKPLPRSKISITDLLDNLSNFETNLILYKFYYRYSIKEISKLLNINYNYLYICYKNIIKKLASSS